MDNSSFVGIGRNPDPNVPDIPLGLGMELMQQSDARRGFEILNSGEKTRVIEYIQASVDGDDTKERIRTVINKLADGSIRDLI